MSQILTKSQYLLRLTRVSRAVRGLSVKVEQPLASTDGLIISDTCVKRLQQICRSDKENIVEFLRVSVCTLGIYLIFIYLPTR